MTSYSIMESNTRRKGHNNNNNDKNTTYSTVILPPFHMYSRPEGRTWSAWQFFLSGRQIFSSGQQMFLSGQQIFLSGRQFFLSAGQTNPVRGHEMFCRGRWRFCRGRCPEWRTLVRAHFLFVLTEFFSVRPRFRLSRQKIFVSDKISCLSWQKKLKTCVVRQQKNVVRQQKTVVRTGKIVVWTTVHRSRTVVLPSGRLYMWNGGSSIYFFTNTYNKICKFLKYIPSLLLFKQSKNNYKFKQ